MPTDFIAIRPNAAPHYFPLFSTAVSVADPPPQLRGAFAFLTRSGIGTLLSHVSNATNWPRIRKRFLVGISQGITEPEGLRRCVAIPNAECRIYVPRRRLDRDALYAVPLFHPKVLCLDAPDGQHNAFVLATSANLTGSAVGNRPRNYEFGIGLTTDTSTHASFVATFDPWWRDMWSDALPVTEARLQQYATLREQSFRRNPDALRLAERPTWIRNAAQLWIEVGMASGIERHQVEFNETLAAFFARPVRRKRVVTLRSQARSWNDRPLSHKQTTFGVDIWRLGMPTVKKGGVPIQSRVILFSRTNTPLIFDFEVANAGSQRVADWQHESNLRGHIGKTQGANSRTYGIM